MKKKRQLITSAFVEAWSFDEDLFFLGEWCKSYSKKDFWFNQSYTVLPYHWDDRQKLYEDSLYLQKIIEKFMSIYAVKLNHLHHLDWSEKSWRIVLLPWVTIAVSCLFDRYFTLLSAVNSAPDEFYTVICDKISDFEFVPTDYSEALDWLIDNDLYNFCLYSYILKHHIPRKIKLKSFEFSALDCSRYFNTSVDKIKNKSLKARVKNTFVKWAFKLNCLNQDIFFSSVRFGLFDLIKLKLRCLKVPLFDRVPTDVSVCQFLELNKNYRCSLFMEEGSEDTFENLCGSILPKIMPRAYIEGFDLLFNQIVENFPKKTKLILTANSQYSNELFKIYSAYQVHLGARYAIIQHGGNYGSAKFSLMESQEITVADKFFSWGWRSSAHPNVVPMPASKLICMSRKSSNSFGSKLLVPMLSCPRYSYTIFSMPIAGQVNDYYSHLESLFQKLLPSIRREVDCRLDSHDYGRGARQIIIDFGLELSISTAKQPLYRALKKSSLCLATYNATIFLETFSLNFPTVIFWDPIYFELKEDAIPYFEILKEVGILFYDANVAAQHINNIYANPKAWWTQPCIQRAKDIFCERYAYVGDSPYDAWRNYLKEPI